MKKKTVATLVAGTAIGAGLGVLFAPKSGKETRQDLKNKITELKEKLENVKVKDVKKYVSEKIEKLETDLKALDKETVLKAAKNKAPEELQEKQFFSWNVCAAAGGMSGSVRRTFIGC